MVPVPTGIQGPYRSLLQYGGKVTRWTPEAPGLPSHSEGGEQLEGLWAGNTGAGATKHKGRKAR